MEIFWLLFGAWCTTMVSSFDLGPIVRIAHCRSQCLRKYTIEGVCDSYASQQSNCNLCWQYCESLEYRWEKTSVICEGDRYLHCPACQTTCAYFKTRAEEIFVPTMLPAPKKAPVILSNFDVAVVMRKVYKHWRVAGYYPAERTPMLRPDSWIIVATEDGVEHYSWQEWVPKLESLREGPLYEATISWKDVQSQLQKQRSLEQVRFNNRVRQFFLEKYGERVLAEWRSQEDSQISDDVFRRFFFRRNDDRADDLMEADNAPSTSNDYEKMDKDQTVKQTFVVSWEPETGGLMGNQVVDSNSAQISLVPGIKYFVRIATNDGPGSFPIEVDTRSSFVHAEKIEETLDYLYPWDVYAACVCVVIFLLVIGLTKVCMKKKSVEIENV